MSVSRVWFGPANTEMIGVTESGAPITAGLDAGVGSMVEITDLIVGFQEIGRASCRGRVYM